ncbi:MAG: 2-oxoacid:acceptor oxidoreductase family protein [Selenomonadaceae bacterium]|nr:2-oxoacid:acceptor oxidoreductase family protein [Selenomonadaceae bacterium]
MNKQLRFSGSGGQGVITAAILFAQSAVAQGFNVVQSQSYGPEARGGASKAEVIIDNEKIFHPHVKNPDVLLALTQKAADKYFHDINPDGVLIIDSDLVPNPPKFPNVVSIPFTKFATEKLGNPLFTNIIALGTVAKVSSFSLDSIRNAIFERFPAKSLESNFNALQLGFSKV